ncbi:COG1361 S-layer family protein [Candidatus Woesearchaeota archaeon]|nr:COG1361 S-layer family protein [Candidatus Woesearchaeota archaeon]
MKKTIPMILVLLLAVASVSAEYTYISPSDIVSASLLNQNPDPGMAGNIVELRVAVENWGAKPSEGYDVEVLLDYPFEAVPGEEYTKNTGAFQGFQVNSEQKILKFKARVDKDATDGNYDLNLLIYEPGEKDYATTKKTLSVEISSRESAEVIYIDKVKLIPGQQTPIEFTINNVGSSPLRELSFSWNNADDIILPVGAGDTKYIKYLGVGEKTTVTYDAMADTNADPGLYKIEMTLTYEDSVTGELTTMTNNAGIYVGGTTDFEVAYSESSGGETSFSVANVGSNPAYSVSVKIPKQDGWTVTGSNSVIIGNLNVGDYTIATFTVQQAAGVQAGMPARSSATTKTTDTTNPQKAPAGNTTASRQQSQDLTVQIIYTDTMGYRNTVEKAVPMSAANNSTANGFARNGVRTVQQQNFLVKYKWYILGLALISAVLVAYPRYRRYREENPKAGMIRSLLGIFRG